MKNLRAILGLINFFFLRKLREKACNIRYKVELSGQGGLRVTGPWTYPGKFISKKGIVGLLSGLKDGKGIYIHVPSQKYDFAYDDRMEVTFRNGRGYEVELLEADAQSYVYEGVVNDIEYFVKNIESFCSSPQKNGLVFNEF